MAWCHGMKTFSALLALCVGNPLDSNGFPSERDNNMELWCFLDVSHNKLLNKQLSCPWFELSMIWVAVAHMWHHCNGMKNLIHWGWVMHICISNLTIICSDNGLSPGLHQAIIWNNAGILLIGPLGTNFNAILIEIQIFSFKKMHLKMSSGKWWPFCLRPNVLNYWV